MAVHPPCGEVWWFADFHCERGAVGISVCWIWIDVGEPVVNGMHGTVGDDDVRARKIALAQHAQCESKFILFYDDAVAVPVGAVDTALMWLHGIDANDVSENRAVAAL